MDRETADSGYPRPASDEAIAKGCTCDPKAQLDDWQIINPECPIHGGVDYILWQTARGKEGRST